MKIRQAIVVIHGMGEQRPNDILRDFVRTAISKSDSVTNEGPSIFLRPDKVSGSYDSLRFQSYSSNCHSQTEFYEYHWAHHMAGNKLVHLWPLIKRLLFRLRVPKRLIPIWLLLVLFTITTFCTIVWTIIRGGELGLPGILGEIGLSIFAVSLIILSLMPINYWFTHYLTDVARYLDASPSNQDNRDAIRKGLIELLTDLHNTDRYSRIIIAAHSLGSIIAYDAITYLWARMNKLHKIEPIIPEFKELKKVEDIGGDLEILKEDPVATKHLRELYQESQRNAWIEKRLTGNPWLITDLITFGSPLAHAQILMATNKKNLREKQDMFEIPRCPPVKEPFAHNKWDGDTWYSWRNSQHHRIIYHAAPFAIVRWTNLWFQSDWFAGPLSSYFGYGINDLKLHNGPLRTRIPLWAHTQYFKYCKENEPPEFIRQIRMKLDLKADNWLGRVNTFLAPKPDSVTQDDTGIL
ncbi:MAG: hypothetical protein AB2541_18280 [Candidatus Thiodiazotropha sp.]